MSTNLTRKLIYLDQNKWIEVAKTFYGRNSDPILKKVIANIESAVIAGKIVLPLSQFHYYEISRIRDNKRRYRLGKVMWRLSLGRTLPSLRQIVLYEIQCALANRFSFVQRPSLDLLGYGFEHALGIQVPCMIPQRKRDAFEQSILLGFGPDGKPTKPFRNDQFRHNFARSLSELPKKIEKLPSANREDAIFAIVVDDIADPLFHLLDKFGLKLEDIGDNAAAKRFINEMPTRALDVHMHRQYVKNPRLRPKETDLEDWGGLGVASQYCDVVVCEKHFADLVTRDQFTPKAKILTTTKDLRDYID